MKKSPLDQLRAICLALPEAIEKLAWGEPTFRVRGKMFAMCNGVHHDDPLSVWCKAPPGVQEILVGAAPKKFFVPPYVGHKGWIGVRLDGAVDWREVAGIVEDAHGMTAPRRRPMAPRRSGDRPGRIRKAAPRKPAGRRGES